MNIDEYVELLTKKPRASKKKTTPPPFESKTFVFSGDIEGRPRYELERIVKDFGGNTHPRITKTVNYLVIPNREWTSSKVDKAREYGITILTIVTFDEMYEYYSRLTTQF